MDDYKTEILPAPQEELDPETALKWLRTDFPQVYLSLQRGFEVDDPRARGAF